MPKERRKNRWEHPHLKYAFCIERYGNVYTVIHGNPPAVIKGLKWVPKNKELALSILTDRYNKYIEHTPNELSKAIQSVEKQLSEIIIEFSKLHFPKLSEGTRKTYITAFNSYLPEDYPITNVDAIRAMIQNQTVFLKHNPNTQLKYLSKLNRLFQYCIDQEYITRNPVINPMKPAPVPTPIKVFTRNEVNMIVEYLNNYHLQDFENGSKKHNAEIKHKTNTKQLALLVEFLSYSGLRISEAIKLWWDVPNAPLIKNDIYKRRSIISGNKIIIDGKRAIHTKPKIREFPIDIVPALMPIINQLEEFKDVNNGKVFRWGYVSKIEQTLKEAITALNLESDRNFHTLRKTALNYWEKELGIPAHISKFLAGHSAATREKFYSTEPSGDELLNMFEKLKF